MTPPNATLNTSQTALHPEIARALAVIGGEERATLRRNPPVQAPVLYARLKGHVSRRAIGGLIIPVTHPQRHPVTTIVRFAQRQELVRPHSSDAIGTEISAIPRRTLPHLGPRI